MKQDLRVTVTKQMIHKALLQLLENKNIDKVKVSELCAESGVNRATFYRHYETLQDVLHEVESDFIRNMPCPDEPPRNIEDVRTKIENICTYMYDHAPIVKILLLNRTDEDMTQTLLAFYKELLERRHTAPFLSSIDSDKYQIIITFFGGGCHYLLKKWIMGDIHKTPKELAEIICEIICFQELT